MLTAQDIMTSQVVSARPDSTVREVADLLVSQGISAVPVIDGDRLVGIVSEGDLLHRAEIGTAPRPRAPVLRDGKVVGIVSRANLIRALATARHVELAPVSRDDSGIGQDILDALRHETWTSVGRADVSVTDGVVTFWGTIQSEAERKASHVLVENIDGVRGLDDRRIYLDMTYGVSEWT